MKFNKGIAKIFISLSLLGSVLGLASCNNDDEPKPNVETTVAEDRQNIQNSMDAMVDCMANLKNGGAVDVLFRGFLGLSEGEIFNENWLENVLEGLDDVIVTDNIDENNRFDIKYYAGTYTYNISNSTWTRVNDLEDKLVFKFPSNPEATTNDAVLTFGGYSDAAAVIGEETLYLPIKASMNLEVAGEKILGMDLNQVSYDSNGDFDIPVKIDFEVYINPFTISYTMDRTTTKEFAMNLSMSDPNNCSMSLDIKTKLNTDDYENLTEENVESVTVVLKANDLTIQSLEGIAELIKMEEPTANDINQLLNIDVLFKDIKIADLKWDESGETMVIFYKDGTSEDTKNFYEEFIEDIEALFDEFFG